VDDLKTPDNEESYQGDLHDRFQRTFRNFILAHEASLYSNRVERFQRDILCEIMMGKSRAHLRKARLTVASTAWAREACMISDSIVFDRKLDQRLAV
jgi:hypothetical protein